jgi:hypothetical protein
MLLISPSKCNCLTLYTYTVVVVATDIREVNEKLSHLDAKTDLGKIHKKKHGLIIQLSHFTSVKTKFFF